MRNYLYWLLCGLLLLMSGCTANSQKPHYSPKIDRITPEALERIMPKLQAQLTLEDIVALSKEGESAEHIIEKIKQTDSLYVLTPSQGMALSAQGVDSKVLDYIHSSRELALRNNMAEEINRREREHADALRKLRRQQLNQRFSDPFCRGYPRFYPYGVYAPRFGTGFGIGAGYAWPWGCW